MDQSREVAVQRIGKNAERLARFLRFYMEKQQKSKSKQALG
jgi:hypothetical protein